MGWHKYKARQVKEDGFVFDSMAEHKRYAQLKLMVKAKAIEGLEVHPAFTAIVNGVKVCRIELDFRYYDKATNKLTYEDIKGMDTPMSKLKRKLLMALFPETVLLILTAK